MSIEEAKEYLRLCNAAQYRKGWSKNLWHGYACDLCGNCCYECSTPNVIIKFFPELENYNEVASFDEWKNSDLVSEGSKEMYDEFYMGEEQ